MKGNLKLRYLFLLTIITMSTIGFVFVIIFSNLYMVDKANLFNSDTWLKPSHSIVDNTEDSFTPQDLQNIQVSLKEQGLFYYNQLSDKDKEIFNYVYLSIQNRRKEIVFEEPIDSQLLTKIVYIIKFDCPEYYFLGTSFDYDIKNKQVICYYPDYNLSQKKYEKMQEEVAKVVEDIKEQVEGKTEYDAEIMIHDYIVQNCNYTIDTKNCSNLYGCLIEKQANCEGYSAAYMYLLRQVGIEATQVIGEVQMNGETIGHSWNLIKIDGEYYYTDISWDDLEDIPEYSDIKYHYAFFNTTYEEMTSSKDITKTLEYLGEIPKTEASIFNYYQRLGLYAKNIDEAKRIIKEKLPSVISSNETFFVIKCNGKEVYNDLVENITDIMQETINENNLAITKCKYAKIENGYTLIIHNFTYNK